MFPCTLTNAIPANAIPANAIPTNTIPANPILVNPVTPHQTSTAARWRDFISNETALKHRELKPELMDDPDLPQDVHDLALRGLTRLNRFSGISSTIFRRIRDIAMDHPRRPIRVLDVASGSGDLPIDWAKRARRQGLPIHIAVTDISDHAIDHQNERARKSGVKIEAFQHDCLSAPLPRSSSGLYDIVTCSLFMHHLDRHQAFCLLQSMQQASSGSVLVCDLERTQANRLMVAAASRLLSRSYIVHHDAPASVRSAFTSDEFKRLADEALARPVNVQRIFPCRFMMTVDDQVRCESVAETSVAFA